MITVGQLDKSKAHHRTAPVHLHDNAIFDNIKIVVCKPA